MELYESLFIIRASVSDQETTALIEKMKAVAEKTGAQFIKSENWGKKKLAYEVKRERKGTYAYFYFRAPNITVGELERSYRLEDYDHQVFDRPSQKRTGAATATRDVIGGICRWPDLTKSFSSGTSRGILSCGTRRTGRRWPVWALRSAGGTSRAMN